MKHSLTPLLLLTLVLLGPPSARRAGAAPVSRQTALAVARQFAVSQGLSDRLPALTADDAPTASAPLHSPADEGVAFHTFNLEADGGFILVAADDQLPPILAYADSGHYDAHGTNPGTRWWQHAVSQLSPADVAAAATTRPDGSRVPTAVAPLLTTAWGQDEPYNYQCPMADLTPWAGFLPTEGHCATGCVATAMAQIMRYHRWPLHGEGSASVFYPLLDTRGHLFTADFSAATYQWDLMIDNYRDGYTTAQAEAVSLLLYHCGVASQMVYGSSSSGTLNVGANEALGRYFGYDMSQARLIVRSELTEPEWMELVYDELAQGRPIFYEGLDINLGHWLLGHSFVIDGYDSDGLVHVNWGWNGQQNGFFNIALLNPGKYSFDEYQDMTIGIRPPTPSQPDAIVTTQAAAAPTAVYTLDGRRVAPLAGSPLPPGVYVSQGRKFVVR